MRHSRLILMMLLVACIISPVFADPVLAQAVDTESMQNRRVGEVYESLKDWKLLSLSVSMLLVIMLLFAGGLLRPGGYAKAGLRDVSTMPAVVWVFAGFVVLLAMNSAPQLINRVQWVQDQQYNATQLQAIHNVGSYLFGIIAGIGMLFILKGSAQSSDGSNDTGLGLSLLDVPVGMGCFVLAFPFIELMNMLGMFAYTQTQSQAPQDLGHPTLDMLKDQPDNPWVWAIVGGAIIGAPIVEELIFRVFLQGALLKWLRSPWLAIVFSSIIFASIHRLGAQPVPYYSLLPIFAVGLTCGVAYERTKRVGVPMTMHICFNALNVLLVVLTNTDSAQTGL